VAEGRASAEVTHAHPDGVAGAVAVAVAAKPLEIRP
jgi:ADP-ribosylglycohydrolase